MIWTCSSGSEDTKLQPISTSVISRGTPENVDTSLCPNGSGYLKDACLIEWRWRYFINKSIVFLACFKFILNEAPISNTKKVQLFGDGQTALDFITGGYQSTTIVSPLEYFDPLLFFRKTESTSDSSTGNNQKKTILSHYRFLHWPVVILLLWNFSFHSVFRA